MGPKHTKTSGIATFGEVCSLPFFLFGQYFRRYSGFQILKCQSFFYNEGVQYTCNSKILVENNAAPTLEIGPKIDVRVDSDPGNSVSHVDHVVFDDGTIGAVCEIDNRGDVLVVEYVIDREVAVNGCRIL